MNFWEILAARLHPRDLPAPDRWRPCYETKHALGWLLQPQSLLEIGVRAGYSAFSFLTAAPQARYLGIDNNSDTHGGFTGSLAHARRLLEPFAATVQELSSTAWAQSWGGDPPHFDVVHIDGDHSAAGCVADLRWVEHCRPRVIVVDDFLGIEGVRSACAQFVADSREGWLSPIVIDDGHNGVALLVRGDESGRIANMRHQ